MLTDYRCPVVRLDPTSPQSLTPVIAVYGLVVSVLIAGNSELNQPARQLTSVSPGEPYPLFAGFVHLGAGLSEFLYMKRN